MYFVGLGLALMVMKYLELGPVAGLSWIWVLSPFALAVAWWAWADASGYSAKRAMEHGVRRVDVLVRGPGSGRETAIRSLAAAGIEVAGIKDVTPIPHNGCRAPKRRRV